MIFSAEDALRAMADLPIVEPESFVRHHLVVIAPHPDDESLGCGGLIAGCRAADLPVTIVIVSDGAGSHPGSQLFPGPKLAELRRGEAVEAAHRLGVPAEAVHFLDLPDRAVPFHGTEANQAADRVAGLCAGADVVAVSWRHDPHIDHKASFILARDAVRRVPGAGLWEYPIWGLTLPPQTSLDSPPVAGVRVRIDPYLEAKRRAIAAHASQTTDLIGDDPDGFRLTPDMLARFEAPEIFLGPVT
ncbi:PIG-L deacetylase family protein [Methylobrevis pamukkalensis]|uniref:1D-myo-inositol 2-acetamido-2-deoxy-alpha-D-glucopyranoside deacetylase n=1 Tax=Methylobrevis pamukkalensis TaxID=1439726 RepID=A0A1E3H6W8_9HYPH|nr:PIG-L deacetylase family protein [Methylobrevis pamukkalensis]ODN71895.1 1D-myo-inositol 2-acetamido-2-deoxy-alpha-D-glucopyranoside deacetylase [Methylobrevis pamukkalensis]